MIYLDLACTAPNDHPPRGFLLVGRPRLTQCSPFDSEGRSSGHTLIFRVELVLIQRMTLARGLGVNIRMAERRHEIKM